MQRKQKRIILFTVKFRTELKPEPSPVSLDPRRPIALLGSCFAENIAARMRRALWDASNPLGTLFNPLSIERSVRLLLFDHDRQDAFARSQFRTGRTIHSWLFDTRTSSEFPGDTLLRLKAMSDALTAALTPGSVLFVTFGTAWCYFLASDPGYVVANCHKQPQSMFIRRRLTVDEIAGCWEQLATDLRDRFPGLRIVFTVSPVRHLKDGFIGNSVSKATLRLAIDELCSRLPFCHYFPAYEIVTDDLRDYRFYASDLVHPSEEAVDYIWEIFKTTYLDSKGMKILDEGERLVKAWEHRPLLAQFSRISDISRQEETARLTRIKADHASFISRNPGMLDLPSRQA